MTMTTATTTTYRHRGCDHPLVFSSDSRHDTHICSRCQQHDDNRRGRHTRHHQPGTATLHTNITMANKKSELMLIKRARAFSSTVPVRR